MAAAGHSRPGIPGLRSPEAALPCRESAALSTPQHGCSADTSSAPALLVATGRVRGSGALVYAFSRCLFTRRDNAKPADNSATLRLAHPLNT